MSSGFSIERRRRPASSAYRQVAVQRCGSAKWLCDEMAYLLPAIRCELDAMVWYELVYVAVLIALGLSMPYEDYHLIYFSRLGDP